MKITGNEISISAVEFVEILRWYMHELYPKTKKMLPESDKSWHIEARAFSYCSDMGKDFERRARRAGKSDGEVIDEVYRLDLYVDEVDEPREIPAGPVPSSFDVEAFGGS